jgi:hypothetical protein
MIPVSIPMNAHPPSGSHEQKDAIRTEEEARLPKYSAQ